MITIIHRSIPYEQTCSFIERVFNDAGIVCDQVPCRIRKGRCFAIAPIDVTEERLLDFKTGGLISLTSIADESQPSRQIAAMIRRRSMASIDRCVWIREPYLDANEAPAITGELRPMGAALYKRVRLDECNEESVADTIERFTVSWTFVMFAASCRAEQSLTELIRESDAIVVGAYDGESYVYWLSQSESDTLEAR